MNIDHQRAKARPTPVFTPAEDVYIMNLYQQGLSYQKIQAHMGKGTPDSVRNAHHRALSQLRQLQHES